MDKVTEAAIRYLELKTKHFFWIPASSFVKFSFWVYVSFFCESISSPTRSFPYSLMTHCRTLKHVCYEFDVEEKAVRYVLKNPLLLMGSDDSWINERIESQLRKGVPV